ncbi:MAG TPA: acyl-CoA dehydrogenase family protein [Stellaceae bacterium]|nr:acyl-CoA dehydrogenase family protein [Stellaceae bacterium]
MSLEPETLKQLVDTVQRFVRERLVPLEQKVAEEDAVPPAIIAEMRELGLFGLSVPQEFGGLGLSMSEEVMIAFELGQTSPAFRSLIGTNNGIGSQGIVLDGTEEQKRKYLPRIASGEIVGSFALTEPGAGSDAASIVTSARRSGNGWVLNGTKRFITNAPHAGLFTVMARTDPAEKGAAGISAFLVEAPNPGLKIGKRDKKMGQQGAHTADVVFEDCQVPADALLGGREGQGFKTAMKVLDRGRLHISAVCVGVAERLIRDSVRYAKERVQFGKPIGEFQLIQAMLADCRAEAYAARSMVLDAARRKDAAENVSLEASCCKYFASEMVGRVADRAVQIHGGAGYIADYGIERFYRDVRLFRIYEGTSQIQQLVIARHMLR